MRSNPAISALIYSGGEYFINGWFQESLGALYIWGFYWPCGRWCFWCDQQLIWSCYCCCCCCCCCWCLLQCWYGEAKSRFPRAGRRLSSAREKGIVIDRGGLPQFSGKWCSNRWEWLDDEGEGVHRVFEVHLDIFERDVVLWFLSPHNSDRQSCWHCHRHCQEKNLSSCPSSVCHLSCLIERGGEFPFRVAVVVW